jgi:hypothetical protein
MQCKNCKKELPADDWIFVRPDAPGKRTETIAAIIAGSEAVYCSQECMVKKEDANFRRQAGRHD